MFFFAPQKDLFRIAFEDAARDIRAVFRGKNFPAAQFLNSFFQRKFLIFRLIDACKPSVIGNGRQSCRRQFHIRFSAEDSTIGKREFRKSDGETCHQRKQTLFRGGRLESIRIAEQKTVRYLQGNDMRTAADITASVEMSLQERIGIADRICRNIETLNARESVMSIPNHIGKEKIISAETMQ